MDWSLHVKVRILAVSDRLLKMLIKINNKILKKNNKYPVITDKMNHLNKKV